MRKPRPKVSRAVSGGARARQPACRGAVLIVKALRPAPAQRSTPPAGSALLAVSVAGARVRGDFRGSSSRCGSGGRGEDPGASPGLRDARHTLRLRGSTRTGILTKVSVTNMKEALRCHESGALSLAFQPSLPVTRSRRMSPSPLWGL